MICDIALIVVYHFNSYCSETPQGHPFMASLKENKALLYSLLFSASAIVGLATGLMPDLASYIELVDLDSEVNIHRGFFHAAQM